MPWYKNMTWYKKQVIIQKKPQKTGHGTKNQAMDLWYKNMMIMIQKSLRSQNDDCTANSKTSHVLVSCPNTPAYLPNHGHF